MFTWALAAVLGIVSIAWGWFYDLITPMMPGNTGLIWFTSVFLALFALNKFVDLFVMNFIYSPSSQDALHARIKRAPKKGD